MVPDIEFVKECFNRFNTSVFKGSLPVPRYALTRARSFRGKLVYKLKRGLKGVKACDFELRISRSFDLPQKEWEDVVIHEMIHLYIASGGIKDSSSHGPEFRKLMSTINRRHGRNIAVSARSTSAEAASRNADIRVRAHYVCLARFSDGRLAAAPVAKTCIFKLWDLKKYFPALASVRWIGSTNPYFNSFPHVQSPKLYKAEESALRDALKGAVLLENTGKQIRVVSRRMTPDELLP